MNKNDDIRKIAFGTSDQAIYRATVAHLSRVLLSARRSLFPLKEKNKS